MDKNKTKRILSKQELLQNATNASSEGITISTMSEPDRPLIYINEGFQRLTGYSLEEVNGKNCRFLQGEATNPMQVKQLREAIQKGEACTVELINYKKDGTPFWNRLSITPILNDNSKVTHYVGIQSDITQLKETKARLIEANKDLQDFRERILRDLEQAKLIQEFIMPGTLPSSSKVEFASLFTPMDEIGGDFFDVIELPEDNYGILIADVSGHGIPAALLTFMSSTTFKNASVESNSPAKTISLTNERLYQKMPEDAFVTMFYAVYNSVNRVLTYTQAGHPEGYILRPQSNEIIPINTGGTLIGAFSNSEVTFTESEIQLIPGDKLIVYTDAISDTLDKYADYNITEDLQSLLSKNVHLPLEPLFKCIYDHGLECSGLKSYSDDFTLLGMEVRG